MNHVISKWGFMEAKNMKKNNILNAKVTIRGTRALLLHRFGPDALPIEKQERTGVAGNDPEEWKRTVMKTTEGQLCLDPSYIFACIRDGAKYVKDGRGSMQPKVSATLQVLSDKVLLDRWLPENIEELQNDIDKPVYMDVRGVRNPNSKGSRNVRYRVAASPGWITTFDIMWDKTIVSRDEIHSALLHAGTLCGLGDGRAIGFGRFQIEKFELLEENNA